MIEFLTNLHVNHIINMSIPLLFFYGFAFIGIVHSIIFSALAFKTKRIADLIITSFLFVQSIIILEYIFFWSGLYREHHYLNNISIPLLLLFGPLLFIYVEYVFYENKKIKNYLFHFIPAIIIFILMLPYYFGSVDQKLFHSKSIQFFVLNFEYVVYFIIAHMTIYFSLILIKILKEKRIGHINNWLLIITGFFGFYIICYISYYIMVNQPWFTLTTDYFVSIGMCASIVSIIYMAYGKKNILNGFPVTESVNLGNLYFSYKENINPNNLDKKKEQATIYNYTSGSQNIDFPVETSTKLNFDQKISLEQDIEKKLPFKYKNSGLTTETVNELADALNQLMKNEKLYRDGDLKLETLANKLGVAKHYISQIINQKNGVNFFEYINLLRIEEAKQLLTNSDKKEMNIIEIAYTVGYNTKNTFNTAFRRIVGITPSEFRIQNKIRLN